MSSKRAFFHTTITVDVLSENAPIPDDLTLAEIGGLIENGPCVGRIRAASYRISPRSAATALATYGSEPGFFCLDDKGNDADL